MFYAVKAKFDATRVFADINQGDDLTYPALQAVDVLVSEAVRKLVEIEHDPYYAEIRKSFKVLRRKQNIVSMELRSDMLRQYVEFVRADEEELRRKEK